MEFRYFQDILGNSGGTYVLSSNFVNLKYAQISLFNRIILQMTDIQPLKRIDACCFTCSLANFLPQSERLDLLLDLDWILLSSLM